MEKDEIKRSITMPKGLYATVKAAAETDVRDVNSQITVLVTEALEARKGKRK